jgi:1,4-dihydroxy-2-naphthoate octaprenyltransferase
MSSDTTIPTRGGFGVWLQAIRAFAFPASVAPILVGAMLTLNYSGDVMWELFPIVFLCSILYHAATNLVSDYYDYIKGVDKDYTFGSSRVIVEGLLRPRQILNGGLLLFGLGIALGFILIYFRGLPMFYLGLIGLLGGYLYCGWPVGFKYIALGDLGVFLLMGPLMVVGSFFTLTGDYSAAALTTPLLVSIPIGFLTAAILHANNTRDIIHDGQARIKTFAGVIGHGAAKGEYLFFVAGAFLLVIVFAILKILPIYSLAVLLSLPPALKNMKQMLASQKGNVEDIATLDVQTAQHHLMFSVLLVVGIAVGAIAN